MDGWGRRLRRSEVKENEGRGLWRKEMDGGRRGMEIRKLEMEKWLDEDSEEELGLIW